MNIIERLKQQGYRLTKPRQEIIKVLEKHPQTVQEIYDTLQKKGIHIDLASVYRSLEVFVTMKVVHELNLGEGKSRYELVDQDDHHHHLVCNNCGSIEDIALPEEEEIIREVQKKSQFLIQNHSLEFFGLCPDCK